MIGITSVRGAGRDSRSALRRAAATVLRPVHAVSARAAAAADRVAAAGTHSEPALQRAVGRPSDSSLFRLSGGVLTMVGVIMLGFVVHAAGVSALSHTRTQATLYDQYRHSLADATAPVGQVDAEGALYPLGTPMAILSIPSIGVQEVVVEGTTSAALLAGPGHRRDSVLPGQSGTSVIMGRQGAYGGPFSRLHELAVGDAISATTGQGTSTYRVVGIRDAATSPAAVDGAGRLTLVTAGGDPWLPEGILRIDAELISTPYATPQRALLVGSLTAAEEAMAPDPSAGLPLLLSLEFAVVAVWACAVGRRRWGRWHVWVATAPVLLVAGALVATQTVILLPNLF